MSKLLTASLLAAGLVAAAPAYAELVSVYDFGTFVSTSSAELWQVAYLEGKNPVSGNPNEGFDWETARKGLTAGDYRPAEAINKTTAEGLKWKTDLEPYVEWISIAASGRSANGYYSYVATFNEIVDISEYSDPSVFSDPNVMFNGLSISYASDDHLHAIIINGTLYTGSNFVVQEMTYPGWTQQFANIMLVEGFEWYNDGRMNTVEFIVHNNNSSGGTYLYADNPTGFAATIQASYLKEASTIPEPETYAMMLVGLGIIGMVARRRKQM